MTPELSLSVGMPCPTPKKSCTCALDDAWWVSTREAINEEETGVKKSATHITHHSTAGLEDSTQICALLRAQRDIGQDLQ